MLLTADRVASGREWAGREFCGFGGFLCLPKYLIIPQAREQDTTGLRESGGTGCWHHPDGQAHGECPGRGRVPGRGRLRGGVLGRAGCLSRGQAANQGPARQAPGAGPALCSPHYPPDRPPPGPCSRFSDPGKDPEMGNSESPECWGLLLMACNLFSI